MLSNFEKGVVLSLLVWLILTTVVGLYFAHEEALAKINTKCTQGENK